MAAQEVASEAVKFVEATENPATGLRLVQTGVESALLEEEVGKIVGTDVLDGEGAGDEGVILQRAPEEGSFRLEAVAEAEQGAGGVSKGEGIVLERVPSEGQFVINMEEGFTRAEADGVAGMEVENAERKRCREQQEAALPTSEMAGEEDRGCSAVEETERKRARQSFTDAVVIANGSNGVHDKEDEAVPQDGEKKGTEAGEKPRRYKKRKVAIFVAYSGVGYQGMQRNPGAITIEGELEEALFRAGAIAESNFGDPKRIDWMRAARTDKGVSAVGQVVSGNFFIDPPGLVERVNSYLPKQVRMLGYKRVIHTFSAKNLCDRRRYVYVLPIFAFDPTVHQCRDTPEDRPQHVTEVQDLEPCNGQLRGDGARLVEMATTDVAATKTFVDLGEDRCPEAQVFVNNTSEPTSKDTSTVNGGCHESVGEDHFSESAEVPASQSSPFRFDDAVRQRLNGILRQYEGTHNFHNFTSRTKAADPSARRYIVSFEAKEVFELDGMEFVRCVVVGQSFMLHQIRKMIGMAVAIMRGCIPETILQPALRPDVNFNVPMAPEVGLFLEECLYPAYNSRFNGTHEAVSLKDFEKEIDAFKSDFIYSHISRSEAKDGVVALWLRSLNDRNYPNFVLARKQGADFGKEPTTGPNS